MNSPLKNCNCITQYKIVEEQVVGKANDSEENFDMQRSAMVYRGNYKKADDDL